MERKEIKHIDDLIASESFQAWIIKKDVEEELYWNQWIGENPSRIEWVAMARTIILALLEGEKEKGLTEIEIKAEAGVIQQRIMAVEESRRVAPRIIKWRYGVVAAASLLLIITGYFILHRQWDERLAAAPGGGYTKFRREIGQKVLEYSNGGDSAQRILLPDGSEVKLERNSQLSYAVNTASGKREAYLRGAAFFNITHDPSQTFIVYTQDLVTRVLGTSFRVEARDNGKTASVSVKTGKVSVFKRENFSNTEPGSGPVKGIVLIPNQRVIYDIAQEQMSKTLADAPEITRDSVFKFDFDDTPAPNVFQQLQDAYGITILRDDEALSSCSISASLGNEPFFEKLGIICRIINASYQVIDGNVVINAKGCK